MSNDILVPFSIIIIIILNELCYNYIKNKNESAFGCLTLIPPFSIIYFLSLVKSNLFNTINCNRPVTDKEKRKCKQINEELFEYIMEKASQEHITIIFSVPTTYKEYKEIKKTIRLYSRLKLDDFYWSRIKNT